MTTAVNNNDTADHSSINGQESDELLGSLSPDPQQEPRAIEKNYEQEESEKAMSVEADANPPPLLPLLPPLPPPPQG